MLKSNTRRKLNHFLPNKVSLKIMLPFFTVDPGEETWYGDHSVGPESHSGTWPTGYRPASHSSGGNLDSWGKGIRIRFIKTQKFEFSKIQPWIFTKCRNRQSKAWFTLVTETETEESLHVYSSVNHENGDGTKADAWWKEQIVSFSSITSSASMKLTLQTSKCEPVLTEVQAETEGWANENALFQSLKTEFDWIRSKVNCNFF